jgi:hypothetical protein
MKPSLPIQLSAIPDPAQSLETWRTVERTLAAIAAKEEANQNLHRSEKIAYNAIAYARYQAHKRQWQSLWQYLLDRQILAIGEVAAPPPKPPKTPRPTKPPKLQTPPKPKQKKKRRSPIFVKFKILKRAALRLQVFLWFADWVATTAPKCKARSPIKKRPDGERIKALLSRKTSDGRYAPLKLWLPSAQKYYQMGNTVLNGDQTFKGLLKLFNPLRKKSEKRLEAERTKGAKRRLLSADQLNQVLTDKWQDSTSIKIKINSLFDKSFSLEVVSKILNDRFKAGEIYQLAPQGNHSMVFYSRIADTTEFESEWINLEMAYSLAVSRGCKAAKNTFRKTYQFNYAAFGLEFRKEVPEHHNSLLRWRDVGV